VQVNIWKVCKITMQGQILLLYLFICYVVLLACLIEIRSFPLHQRLSDSCLHNGLYDTNRLLSIMTPNILSRTIKWITYIWFHIDWFDWLFQHIFASQGLRSALLIFTLGIVRRIFVIPAHCHLMSFSANWRKAFISFRLNALKIDSRLYSAWELRKSV
jgi:hypothetical protein